MQDDVPEVWIIKMSLCEKKSHERPCAVRRHGSLQNSPTTEDRAISVHLVRALLVTKRPNVPQGVTSVRVLS